MEDAQNPINIVLIDACRNNPYSRGWRSASRGLAHVQSAEGIFISFATAPGKIAADGNGRNSPYTVSLLQHIQEPGVPVPLLFQRVRQSVREKTNGQQITWESSSLIGDFVFKSSESVTPSPASTKPVSSSPQSIPSLLPSFNKPERRPSDSNLSSTLAPPVLASSTPTRSLFALNMSIATFSAEEQEKVSRKLDSVPVFIITNAEGSPFIPPSSSTQSPVKIFISQSDAQIYLNTLKSRDSGSAKTLKITAVSLARAYMLTQNSNLNFTYIPSENQVNNAISLLRKTGQKMNIASSSLFETGNEKKGFIGTPLFVARVEGDKYLKISQGGKTAIPIFFKQEELQSLINQLKQKQPKLMSTVEIEVLRLEDLIDVIAIKNDPELNQILLFPAQD